MDALKFFCALILVTTMADPQSSPFHVSDWCAKFYAWLNQDHGANASIVSFLSLLGSIFIFIRTYALTRNIANRTVVIEAQKLLLEINKQLMANPDLFAIYDNEFVKYCTKNGDKKDEIAKLKESIRALAFMHLNVFEIVFAVHPSGKEKRVWTAYFKDSLDRCSAIREALESNSNIYSKNLLKVSRRIQKGSAWLATGRRVGQFVRRQRERTKLLPPPPTLTEDRVRIAQECVPPADL